MTLPIIFLLVLVNGTMENMLEQMENEEWVITIPKIIIKERKNDGILPSFLYARTNWESFIRSVFYKRKKGTISKL